MTPNVAIFFRAEGWYPIEFIDPSACGLSMEQQAAQHAETNPGTLRVEDVNGTVLWRLQ